MSKKRNWLDRISGWILDALPSEKDNKQKTGKTTTSNLERAKRKAKSQRASESGKKSNTTAIPRSQVTKQAWIKFEEEWAKLGFARDQFVSDEEVSTLIQALEKEFKDDLTEALYQLSINREAIQSLRDILNRGKVAVGDNLTAIRSYAYIGILASNTKRSTNEIDDSKISSSTDHQESKSEGTPENRVTPEKKSKSQTESEEERREILLQTDLRDLTIQRKTLNSLLRAGFDTIGDLGNIDKEGF